MSIFESKPQFKLRGNRNYLSATTVFDWVSDSLESPKEIDFQFHIFADKHVNVSKEPGSKQNTVATYRRCFETVYLIDSQEQISEMYPCNEHLVVDDADFDSTKGSFSLPAESNATYTECIVAIYKAMLQLTPDGSKGKLIFGRLKLEYVPKVGACVVEHRRMIGDKFFEANLIHNDQKIGSLYFGQQ